MHDNFEDTIENMMKIMCPSDMRARVRLTAFGPEDRVTDALSVVKHWEEIGSKCRNACPENIGSGKTFTMQILDPAQFIRELKPVAPDILMLISWGFPLCPQRSTSPEGWRGRGVVFRWESFLSAPDECPLTTGDDETKENAMARVHLWRMELYRTHHQWKQGFTDAAHVQMV